MTDQELASEVKERFSSIQLSHIAAAKRQEEISNSESYQEFENRIISQADPDSNKAFISQLPTSSQCRIMADLLRSIEIDDDIFGALMVRGLMARGISRNESAHLVKEATIKWRDRTAEDRAVSVAEALLSHGIPERTIIDTIKGLFRDLA